MKLMKLLLNSITIKLFFFIIVILLLIPKQLFAFEVTHQIRPGSVFETTALNNACSTMKGSLFSSRCNPALFETSKEQGIYLSLVSKAEGDSIDNGRDLIFKPITEEVIRRLLQERNFNSFTFNGEVVFKNRFFELSYSPYYLLADLYIFNPAFLEVSIHLANIETLRLTHGRGILKYSPFKDSGNDLQFNLSLGSSLFYYEHSFENIIISLYDLSYKKATELITFKTIYGTAADVGLFLDNNNKYIPTISAQVKNINSKINEGKKDANSKSSLYQSTLLLFDTYSSIGIGKNFNTILGGFNLDIELPFTSFYQELVAEQITLGCKYSLSLFSLFFGLAKYYQNIGLRFDSSNFNIGIIYAREEDMGKLQPKLEQTIYLGVDIIL
ncbi:MAG: hypothetical protein HQK51_05235 [Oligoflexia bacterium]|nr:hypothetical protein [Oligoflexia bacterium]